MLSVEEDRTLCKPVATRTAFPSRHVSRPCYDLGMRTISQLFCLVLAGAALLSCPGCAAGQSYVELKGQRFRVEVADTPEKWSLGLMFRDHLPENHGMLFIFPREAPRSFWMKNTRIPLDILYFDRDLKLVSTTAGARPCRTRVCPGYPSAGPAQYVLELNAGKASELGVAPGDSLVLELD
jgi:uncharacterized membrane protein (UPF0127 family)